MSTITEESTIVWSKMMCPQCTAAKQLLKLNEITYEERMIGDGWTKEQLLEKAPIKENEETLKRVIDILWNIDPTGSKVII